MTLKKNVVSVDIWIGKIRTTIQFNQELKLKNWTVIVEEDPETGDLILPLPLDLLEEAGWKEGDSLNWIDQKDGSWQLKKVDTTSEKSV
jgi:hypothetical protein